jgi:type II secretory pathway predicted ATPase ExeA
MVLGHFKLREQPFGVTPDPRYLYASATHREALASILYGVESGLGFLALTAKPGMGKTTLLFEVLRRMRDTTRTVFLFQTISSPADLVRALLIDLGVKEIRGSLVEMQSQLNEVLVAQSATGKRLVVAIDEAQNLNESVLEAVRMLSNFETARQKLMQVVLSGQLQLAEQLAAPQLLQLRQRISIFAHLKPLSITETTVYVQHRLNVSGYDSAEPIFTNSAMALLARHSEGIPRNINTICFNALSLGCALGRKTIDSDVVREVVADLALKLCDEPATAPEPIFSANRHTGATRPSIRVANAKVPVLSMAAVTCAIVLVFGWLSFRYYPAIAADDAVQASSNNTLSAFIPPPDANPSLIVIPGPQTRLVQVHKGQSLYDICVANFGKCRPEVLREIIRINSTLHNPDHIETGQTISIPVVLPTSLYSK